MKAAQRWLTDFQFFTGRLAGRSVFCRPQNLGLKNLKPVCEASHEFFLLLLEFSWLLFECVQLFFYPPSNLRTNKEDFKQEPASSDLIEAAVVFESPKLQLVTLHSCTWQPRTLQIGNFEVTLFVKTSKHGMIAALATGPNDSFLAGSVSQPTVTVDFKELTTIVLSIAGPIFFMCMQISSLQTARTIFITKRVGNLSSFPFLSLITNGTVWFIYGSVKADWTILIPNFTAVVVGGICTTIFQNNSKDDIPKSSYAFTLVVILPSLVFGFRGDSISLGLMGVFVSILLMGSPLSTVTTVLKERRTDSMPFKTSFAAFLNSLSWTLYGYIIANDLMLWLPAVIGLLLATFQLTLFIFFGFPSSSPRQETSPQSFISVQVIKLYSYSFLQDCQLNIHFRHTFRKMIDLGISL